jgi:hypothetical protein
VLIASEKSGILRRTSKPTLPPRPSSPGPIVEGSLYNLPLPAALSASQYCLESSRRQPRRHGTKLGSNPSQPLPSRARPVYLEIGMSMIQQLRMSPTCPISRWPQLQARLLSGIRLFPKAVLVKIMHGPFGREKPAEPAPRDVGDQSYFRTILRLISQTSWVIPAAKSPAPKPKI